MSLSTLVLAITVTVNAVPNQDLEKAFVSTNGWTGGDAAYSVPLTKQRSLWLFGDSFIGRIDKGVRTKMDMVHNSAAWLDEDQQGRFKPRFFWKKKANSSDPASLLAPKDGKKYYWPSAVLEKSGKLAIFCKVVENIPGDNSGFGFNWTSEELVLVDNADAPPTQWRAHAVAVPAGEVEIMPGAGALIDEGFAYVYGTRKAENTHNVVLMRVPAGQLFAGEASKFEYWSGSKWETTPLNCATLFPGAPELSVSRVEGLPGYWCIYSANGLSDRIMLRHADKPEGPWSESMLAYTAPEAARDKSLLCYGAKAHPELAHKPRTLVVTYCLNPGGAAEHKMHPYAYFPRAITITVTPKKEEPTP